ncbi:MAG TPA: MaoC/PaaZ C-terminal domain-containing protein [Jatrophihabitans sp.]|jgi:acyl dehydratase
MPIDPGLAVGADLPPVDFEWSESDVLLYHLALGAGTDPTHRRELRYATEDALQVLPTFAVVAPTLHATEAPRVHYPGIEIDLSKVLHGTQRIEVHRALPTSGKARASARVTDVWDKGNAAVVVTETIVADLDGTPLWTNTSSIFARGEGGFGGERGPSSSTAAPEREPDYVIVTPTLPQQALWYRLLGDRNPLHSDPAFAAKAGFDRPILHGLCTYGMVAKALVDTLLDGDAARLRAFEVRFTGIVVPGETLRTSVWQQGDRRQVVTTVDDRADAPALSGTCS